MPPLRSRPPSAPPGADHVPGRRSKVVETLVVENGVGTCPPDCGPHGNDGGGR
ncbi:MAG TPA: hypothetical protein VEX86_18000 [Longimicrobium sp.]|nr:hypothetical protein [Longimicrobium sp.]